MKIPKRETQTLREVVINIRRMEIINTNCVDVVNSSTAQQDRFKGVHLQGAEDSFNNAKSFVPGKL